MEKKAFSESVLSKLKYYVYALVNSDTKKIFYIGKGVGNRVFDHVNGTLKEETGIMQGSNPLKIDYIEDLKHKNIKIEHLILRHNIESEDKALLVESVLIDLLSNKLIKNNDKIADLMNIQAGHGQRLYGIADVETLEAKYTDKPITFYNDEPVLCININKTYGERRNVYESVRWKWKISKKNANRCKYILAEFHGVCVGVFKTDEKGWLVKDNYCYFNGSDISETPEGKKYMFKIIPRDKGEQAPCRYFPKLNNKK